MPKGTNIQDHHANYWQHIRIFGAPSECWTWVGSSRNGDKGGPYGQVTWKEDGKVRNEATHRIAVRLAYGYFPGKGSTVDHLCRDTLCVNPLHLEVVSHTVNVARGIGPTAVNTAKTHCDHGHGFTPDNTYKHDAVGGRRCKICHLTTIRKYLDAKLKTHKKVRVKREDGGPDRRVWVPRVP